jgi:hypothetical protein
VKKREKTQQGDTASDAAFVKIKELRPHSEILEAREDDSIRLFPSIMPDCCLAWQRFSERDGQSVWVDAERRLNPFVDLLNRRHHEACSALQQLRIGALEVQHREARRTRPRHRPGLGRGIVAGRPRAGMQRKLNCPGTPLEMVSVN